MTTDCIFCKIIVKEVPNYTIYEDEHVLAFLDIHPHAKGHTVVIPKRHAELALELSDEETKQFFLGVKRTMERIKNVLKSDGCTVGWNDGKAGGQAVPHVHVHILPRWFSDGGGSMHSVIKNPGSMSVADVHALF